MAEQKNKEQEQVNQLTSLWKKAGNFLGDGEKTQDSSGLSSAANVAGKLLGNDKEQRPGFQEGSVSDIIKKAQSKVESVTKGAQAITGPEMNMPDLAAVKGR